MCVCVYLSACLSVCLCVWSRSAPTPTRLCACICVVVCCIAQRRASANPNYRIELWLRNGSADPALVETAARIVIDRCLPDSEKRQLECVAGTELPS